MKRVILFRHAKSSWKEPGQPDHDRPLNGRGRRSAPLMGRWLAEAGWRPDHVLCSSSLRTRETWALAAPAFAPAPTLVVEPRLYHAEPETMLDALRGAPEAAGTVMMIGHQPGIGAFAAALLGDRPGEDLADFPTAACAVIDIRAARWRDAGFGDGALVAYQTPRALEDE